MQILKLWFSRNSKLVIPLALLVALAVFLGPAAWAQVPPGYYDNANGKTGSQLRTALHDIIDDHFVIPHNSSGYDTHDAIDDLDEDPNNPSNVIVVYSGYSMAKSSWPDYNREHTWPKSYGAGSGPAETDMHHVLGCDLDVNGTRDNKYFDNGGTSHHPEAPDCSYDFDSWEVRDEEKGDLARIMFYMDVRYNGDESNELDLELTDNIALIQISSRYMGKLSTLLEWHDLDPVDDKERARNEFIYQNIQFNRNPFVDNPSFVYSLWGGELVTDTYTLSVATGGTANLTLEAGSENSNRVYLILGSMHGTEPGIPLPGGLTTLPLVWDSFTDLILGHLNSGIFQNFLSALDGTGHGAAQINAPSVNPSKIGKVMHFAYCLQGDPWDMVSNPIAIEWVP